eukprot:347417-Chlamydomonas_euryale.AAC.9
MPAGAKLCTAGRTTGRDARRTELERSQARGGGEAGNAREIVPCLLLREWREPAESNAVVADVARPPLSLGLIGFERGRV